MMRAAFAGLLVFSTWMVAGCGGTEGNPTPTNRQPPDGGETTPPPAPKPDRIGCAQDAYTETLPTTDAITATFSVSNPSEYLLAALETRYPFGKTLVEGGVASPMAADEGNCLEHYLDAQEKDTAEGVLRSAAAVVHECGHLHNLGKHQGSDPRNTYAIHGDLELTCTGGDTTSRGGATIARSRIRHDAYSALRQACEDGQSAKGCDMYADIYLTGDPDDAKFESGDQGLNMLLEEATQYVNSLATGLAFHDSYGRTRITHRDGVLTFLWYIERYLALARESYAAEYKAISEDPCWRQVILTIWDRGWFYLRASEPKASLSLDAEPLTALVMDPKLVGEIDALRQLECK